MDVNAFRRFDDIDTKEIAPGFFSKLIHTETNTINFIEVKAGCAVHMLMHVHQQYSFVTEGKFEMEIDGVTQVLDSGSFALVPSNAWHSGKAITNCKLIDVFTPVRQDYMNL